MCRSWRKQILLLLACVAGVHATRSRLRTGSPKRLCEVRGDVPVNVYLLPHNGRAISFGENPNTTETRVKCLGSVLAANCESMEQPVDDVAACPDCPCNVDDSLSLTPSNEVLYDQLMPICTRASKSRPMDVLMLGLGGGQLHRHIRQTCPEGTRVRSVEYDPRVASIAQRFFGVEVSDGESEVVVGDGGEAVRKLAASLNTKDMLADALGADPPPALGKGGWDVVITDCFVGHGKTPETCRSPEFIGAVHSLLKPNGVSLHHLWHYSPEVSAVATDFDNALAGYKTTFGADAVTSVKVPRTKNAWDDVVVARNNPSDATEGQDGGS